MEPLTRRNSDQQFERLNDWLEVIKKEVQQLRVDQHIFWEVQEIIQHNARINKLGSTFYQWMGSAYATSMAVAIRRQVDHDARSISLLNFLAELRDRPDVLSRARYKRIFTTANSAMPEKFQDQDYDRLVGTGRDTVDPSNISDEIAQLEKATEDLRQYVNKRIAHHDEGHITNFPRFHDVDAALDCLEHLVIKYLHLFRAISIRSLLPTWQYDWKEVFRHPWILGDDPEARK